MKYKPLISFFVLLGCSTARSEQTKIMDFGSFEMTVPQSWVYVKAQGIDSYVGHLALDHGDSASFDMGWYSSSLEEYYNFSIENGNVYLLNEAESEGDSTFYEFYGRADTIDLEDLMVNKTRYTVIDGRKAKLVEPRQSGAGTTGVYFDSLWQGGSGTTRFQMNGVDLKPENQRELIKAFETLKFKRIN